MIQQFGEADEMQWGELPTPQPRKGEVQIKVAYTAVNPVDWKIREGSLTGLFDYEFPIIPGWDAAGTISAIGDQVTSFEIGDEVYSYCRKPIVQWGTYAEYVCFDADNVAPKPKSLNFAKAAAIPLVGLTAWQALFDNAHLKKGQSVLIHAGAGGVGSLAIAFAKEAGATTIYTTASSPNHAYVKKLGADVAIDYHKEDFVHRIRELEADGADVILDCAGYQALERSYDIVKKGGYLVSIVNAIDKEKLKEKGINGSFMIVSPNGDQLRKIGELIDQGKVLPPEIHEMSIQECVKAHELSKEGHTKGKIVLRINEL